MLFIRSDLFIFLSFAVRFAVVVRKTRRSRRRRKRRRAQSLTSTLHHRKTKVNVCLMLHGHTQKINASPMTETLMKFYLCSVKLSFLHHLHRRGHSFSLFFSFLFWATFIFPFNTLFSLPPASHFKPSFPDEPVTSPTNDRSSVAKKRFTLQGFSWEAG